MATKSTRAPGELDGSQCWMKPPALLSWPRPSSCLLWPIFHGVGHLPPLHLIAASQTLISGALEMEAEEVKSQQSLSAAPKGALMAGSCFSSAAPNM